MYFILNPGLSVKVARGVSRAAQGRRLNFPIIRLHGNCQINSRSSLRHHLKRHKTLNGGNEAKNCQRSFGARYLFVFPLVPAVYSFYPSPPGNDSKHLAAIQNSLRTNLDLKNYSTRSSLVRYLYKTWDLIRFLLSLSKFVFLYSPFLLTYPLCYLSTNAEDLWWILLKKAIVLGGPVTVEFAKWLGTREDLFLHKTCLNLASVSLREHPHSWYSTKKKLRRAFGNEWINTVVKFEPSRTEVATSELTQVYKAKLPLDGCSEQIAEEIVKDVDDFEGLEEPFLADGIEIVGLGAWMSGHDEDDIVDNAFGSWMMSKQGLAESATGDGEGVRSAPIVIPPPPEVVFAPLLSDSEVKPKLRERIRDQIQDVQLKAAEKFVHVISRGLETCNNAIARSYALMAKVGTMRQELQIVPDPFDLTPAIPPKPVAESVAVDEFHDDKLYLEELLPESPDIHITQEPPEDNFPIMNFALSGNNSNNNIGNNNIGNVDKIDDTLSDQNCAIGFSGDGPRNVPKISYQDEGKGNEVAMETALPDVEHTTVAHNLEQIDAPREENGEGFAASPILIANVPEMSKEGTLGKTLERVAAEEIREKIPELTPEEVAIDEIVEGTTEETQPHIPESVSEGVEALIQIGADAVKSAKDGMKEGVAQMKESVGPFVEIDQIDDVDAESEDSVLLQFHPMECACHLCQGLVPVAVKVLHPGVVRKSIRDLDVLRLLAGVVQIFVPWLNWWQPATCVDEFGDRLHRLINLKREAIALERFNINFAANPHIRFPRPMRPFVHRDVMVEMWEESDNIHHYLMTEDGEEGRSQMPYSLRSSLAEIISEALVKMIFDDNYVHCDINELNVLVQNGKYFIENPPDKDKLIQVEVMDTIVIATEENKNPLRLVLCDANVASHISQPQAFADIFEGILKRDPVTCADAFDAFISESSRAKDLSEFKEELLRCFHRHSISREGQSPDLTLLVEDLYRVVYCNQVKMEDDFVAVLTSMLSVETIGKKLIGKNQNLFRSIEKYFAKQFDRERV